MAKSPSHRFGQIIGNLLEELLLPRLSRFCEERNLYLDRHGARAGARGGKRVSWEDKYGNEHNLDFVIERDGSNTKRGAPVAFIEAAWRRYTKHSRAKAQEIQGAVLPITEKYERDQPFLGVVIAGFFTNSARTQMESVGIRVAYLPYDTIAAAFSKVGIEARFDENTPDEKFAKCAAKIEKLPLGKREQLKAALLTANEKELDKFFSLLRSKWDRLVTRIAILPLFGAANEFKTAIEAETFIEKFNAVNVAGEFRKFEIIVTFSNRDEMRGTFSEKAQAIDFLKYVSR